MRYEFMLVRCGVASCWGAVVSTCFVNDVRTERANKRINKRPNARASERRERGNERTNKQPNAATEARANERTHATKIEPKSLLGRSRGQSGQAKIDEKSRKITLDTSLGRSWRALGQSLRALGRSWRAPGRSWRALGRSWRALGRSWHALGATWALPGRLRERSRPAFLARDAKKPSEKRAERF